MVVSEISSEIITAMHSVIANSRNIWPIVPPCSSKGMNTATSDSVMEMIVKPISREPRSAARNGFSPISMWR